MTCATSLPLNKPPPTEERALMDRALKVAREYRQRITPARLAKDDLGCALDGLEGLMKVIGILNEGGK